MAKNTSSLSQELTTAFEHLLAYLSNVLAEPRPVPTRRRSRPDFSYPFRASPFLLALPLSLSSLSFTSPTSFQGMTDFKRTSSSNDEKGSALSDNHVVSTAALHTTGTKRVINRRQVNLYSIGGVIGT